MNQQTLSTAANKVRGDISALRKQVSAHIEKMRKVADHLDMAELALVEQPRVGFKPWGRKKQAAKKAKATKKTVARKKTKAMGTKRPPRRWPTIIEEAEALINTNEPLTNSQLWDLARKAHPDLRRDEQQTFNNVVRTTLRKKGYQYEGPDRLHMTWRRQAAPAPAETVQQ